MIDSNSLWPGWETVGLIGRGSFGAVYKIQRDVLGDIEEAALKVISIPQNEGDIEEMYNDGYDEESVTSTFRMHLKSIVAEYSLMRKMNDTTNIVTCDDVRYVQHENGIGWDIYIKMELLIPLAKGLSEDFSEETVIKIARDMCAALEACGKHNIVHRDIKPQNIFVSKNGDYKLGDFGIAKTVEKTMGGTKIGTYKYMAPEVYNNQPYNASADIYSLGLVLYWILNERRMPFMPLPPEKLCTGMEERARNRRMSGEKIPAPKNGSMALKQIVMKACAFDPKERYASAWEMLRDLQTMTPASKTIPDPAKLDVHEELTFAYKNHPAGKQLTIRVDTKDVQFAVPKNIEDGQTIHIPGKGRYDSSSGNTGDLYVTIHIEPAPEKPRIPIIAVLCAAIAVVAIILTVVFAGPKEKNAAKQHVHIWKDATCTTSRICQECSATEGNPLGHTWVEATLAAPKTCTVCGATEGEKLTVEPIYLNELGVAYHEGKVWTRSEEEPSGVYHTKADTNPTEEGVESCWLDWDVPGHTVGVVTDNQGNVYTYGISVDGKGSKNYYLEFYLGGKYTKFSGICACPDESGAISNRVYNEELKQDKYFEVYLDDRLAGQSPVMRYDFGPQQFEFDVTGVNILRIMYPPTNGPNEVATIFDGLLS